MLQADRGCSGSAPRRDWSGRARSILLLEAALVVFRLGELADIWVAGTPQPGATLSGHHRTEDGETPARHRSFLPCGGARNGRLYRSVSHLFDQVMAPQQFLDLGMIHQLLV